MLTTPGRGATLQKKKKSSADGSAEHAAEGEQPHVDKAEADRRHDPELTWARSTCMPHLDQSSGPGWHAARDGGAVFCLNCGLLPH